MLAITAVRLNHFKDDDFLPQGPALRQHVFISWILPEQVHVFITVTQMPLDNLPHSLVNRHAGSFTCIWDSRLQLEFAAIAANPDSAASARNSVDSPRHRP